MFKVVVFILLIAMLASLGSGLYYLVKAPSDKDKGNRLVKALTWRIGIWVVLFLFIILSMKMNWIKPSNSVHPVNFNQQQQERIDTNNK